MSKNEKDADAFDCDLFRLMDKAHRFSEIRGHDLEWSLVRDHLNRARAIVRSMMNQKRRAETAG